MERVKVSHTDLLIIGAGPAGLMAAAWASQYGIRARIIDDKAARVQTGHADGITCRTMEILDSFGIANRILEEAFYDSEMRSWVPDEIGGIRRAQTVLSQKAGISRFGQYTLTQGRLEELFVELLSRASKLNVEWSMNTLALSLDKDRVDDPHSYPISLEVQHGARDSKAAFENMTGKPCMSKIENGTSRQDETALDQRNGHSSQVEIIRAKYLIGCDGAHSWTRKQLGLTMEGEQTDQIWGVMDIIPLTNFPDIRQTCAIHSSTYGSIHLVPREGRLVRFYVQIVELSGRGGRLDKSAVTPELLLRAVQNVLAPYKLESGHLDWWSAYQVGQRVANSFSVMERVFLAGDAIHTHSPKVGQGMNVSFQDTYNLVWKVCSVINGTATRKILSTYQTERRQVALDLIRIDHETSQYYAYGAQDKPTNPTPGYREDLQTFRDRMYSFLSGVAVEYDDSVLIAKSTACNGDTTSATLTLPPKQHLARHVLIGRRMPSWKVLNHADARPTHVAEMLQSNGKWRVFVFAGDLTVPAQFDRIQTLGRALCAPQSFIRVYTPHDRAGDSLFEVLTILSGPRDGTPLLHLPEVFHPYDEHKGWDYWKVFADDGTVHEGLGDAYLRYGIDEAQGCIIVCRPDQHVGYVGGLEDVDQVNHYFSQFLIASAK